MQPVLLTLPAFAFTAVRVRCVRHRDGIEGAVCMRLDAARPERELAVRWVQLAGLGISVTLPPLGLMLWCLSTSNELLLKIGFVGGLLVEKGGPFFLRR